MTDYIYHNGELYHHGVKGMKWGVRKSKNIVGDRPPLPKGPVMGPYKRPEFKTIDQVLSQKMKKQQQVRRDALVNDLSKKSKVVKYGSEFVKNVLSFGHHNY
jgi:hypothetical protein